MPLLMEWWWWTTYLFAYGAVFFFLCCHHCSWNDVSKIYFWYFSGFPQMSKFPFFSFLTRIFMLEHSPASSHSIPIPGTLNCKQLAVPQICHVLICLLFFPCGMNAFHFPSYFNNNNNNNVYLSGFSSDWVNPGGLPDLKAPLPVL